ncbi:MAG: hypothetical protein ACLP8A_08265 [Methylovirgula sp.]
MEIKSGDFIGIVCEVMPGPFSEERLVTVQTVDGAISGFVKVSELRQSDDRWEVRGKVRSVSKDFIEVWILGSFFTTNGIANIPTHLAMAA